jgi:hypothetical protein
MDTENRMIIKISEYAKLKQEIDDLKKEVIKQRGEVHARDYILNRCPIWIEFAKGVLEEIKKKGEDK